MYFSNYVRRVKSKLNYVEVIVKIESEINFFTISLCCFYLFMHKNCEKKVKVGNYFR